MKITRDHLRRAGTEIGLSEPQLDRLWEVLRQTAPEGQKFDVAHVAYYLGAMIAISAMGWLTTVAWGAFGGYGLFTIAVVYATVFVLAGRKVGDRPEMRVPAGLLLTMAVCMTPLGVYGLQRATGLWPDTDPGEYRGYYEWVKGGWFAMEVGTIAAGLVALRARRFAFLTAPIAFSLWFMSMDIAPLLYGRDAITGSERAWVSLVFGLAMLVVAYLVDLANETSEDLAFWGYLFGVMAFWGGLTLMDGDTELARFIYMAINVLLIGVSVFLRQRVFVVFGSLGVMGYLSYLSYRLFADSILFPFVLTGIGVFIIWAGVVYQRQHHAVEAFMRTQLPAGLRRLVPARARNMD